MTPDKPTMEGRVTRLRKDLVGAMLDRKGVDVGYFGPDGNIIRVTGAVVTVDTTPDGEQYCMITTPVPIEKIMNLFVKEQSWSKAAGSPLPDPQPQQTPEDDPHDGR
jgi:hypothetical protein